MKTVTITVSLSSGNPQTLTITIPITDSNPSAIPTSSQWDQILAHLDNHVGGRPKDR